MSVNVTFRIDEDIKKKAEELFDELGMNLSTAFNVFLRQAVREQQIPFMISANQPNETTLSAMDDAEMDRDIYGPFDSVAAMMEALNA